VNRTELKFYIKRDDILTIRNIIEKIMKLDSYTNLQKRDYQVTSLYFDTFDNKDLDEKLAGILKRRKIRIRYYGDNSIIKFEVKNRENLIINKESVKISKNEAAEIIQGNYDILNKFIKDNECLARTYLDLKTNIYRPRVVVRYDREAYVLPYGNTRITFDKNLRTSNNKVDLFNSKNLYYPILDDDIHILEVKYSLFLPQPVKYILNSINTQVSSISKFALCQKYIEKSPWVDRL
jgi:hypothetical protein